MGNGRMSVWGCWKARWSAWELENGSGVHRRAGPANDNQGVDAQHEQVPALFRAHLGQRLQKGIVQRGHATLALRWKSKSGSTAA